MYKSNFRDILRRERYFRTFGWAFKRGFLSLARSVVELAIIVAISTSIIGAFWMFAIVVLSI